MIKKRKTKFTQHLTHNDEVQDFNKFIDKNAPLIGYIVQSFNSLEQSLNNTICKFLHSGTDEIGLLVIHNMPYVSKVELFGRLSKSLHLATGTSQNTLISLLSNLKECAKLRNAVVHADWENTDYQGYTFVKIQFAKDGLEQEYYQFTVDALEKIDEFIEKIEDDLWTYEEEQETALTGNRKNNG